MHILINKYVLVQVYIYMYIYMCVCTCIYNIYMNMYMGLVTRRYSEASVNVEMLPDSDIHL